MTSNSELSSNSSTEIDWKARYTDLVGEFDHLEQNYRSDSSAWKKAINRLSQAANDYSGADSQLLAPLTRALENNESAAAIVTAVNDLCLRLPEQNAADNSTVAGPPNPAVTAAEQTVDVEFGEFREVFSRLCHLLGIEKSTARRGDRQANPVSPAAEIHTLIEQLNQTEESPRDRSLNPVIIELIIQLLENLPRFTTTNEAVENLVTRARRCRSLEQLSSLLEELVPLADHIQQAIEQERLQNADFLNLTWQRLSELAHYFESTRNDNQQSSLAQQELQSTVSEKINHLLDQANTAETLPALKQLLGQSVETIRGRIDNYVADEVPRLRRAEQQCQQLANRVLELQKETTALKQTLAAKQQEANCDALTRLANRRAFDQILNKEHSRWQRHGRPLSVVFLDIDFFKRINDEFGHKAGDAALVSVSRIMQRCLREHDLLARYGGEEFVALLPDTDEQAAFEVAEKLRSAVMETQFRFEQQPLQVTLSCGIAAYAEGESPRDALNRADAALYEAKNGGRNQTCVSPVAA